MGKKKIAQKKICDFFFFGQNHLFMMVLEGHIFGIFRPFSAFGPALEPALGPAFGPALGPALSRKKKSLKKSLALRKLKKKKKNYKKKKSLINKGRHKMGGKYQKYVPLGPSYLLGKNNFGQKKFVVKFGGKKINIKMSE